MSTLTSTNTIAKVIRQAREVGLITDGYEFVKFTAEKLGLTGTSELNFINACDPKSDRATWA